MCGGFLRRACWKVRLRLQKESRMAASARTCAPASPHPAPSCARTVCIASRSNTPRAEKRNCARSTKMQTTTTS
eukprot:1329505-Rhodomonas_salina.1